MIALQIALLIVAGLLAFVELVRSKWEALIAWAVLAIAVALLTPILRNL